MEYSKDEISVPIKKIEKFFKPFVENQLIREFVLSNNGANVMLRILAQLLKFEHLKKKKMRGSDMRKLIVTPTIRFFQREYGTKSKIKSLRKQTSNEARRAELAKEIMREISKEPSMKSFKEEISV